MITRITVTNQDELDAAIAKYRSDADVEIFVDSDPGVLLDIMTSPGDADLVVGSASVVWVGGSASVDSVGGSARVVRVGDSARVDSVGDSASVDWVGDSARVGKAGGTSVLHLYGTATLGRAGIGVTVYLHSQKVTMSGGHVNDMTNLDASNPVTWADMQAVEIDADGLAHLYKAVDDQLMAGHSWTPTAYPIGEDVTPFQWADNNQCGYGLHACPTPAQARNHYTAATRFLEVTCPVTDLRPIDASKCKAPRLHVLREVDIHGDPIDMQVA